MLVGIGLALLARSKGGGVVVVLIRDYGLHPCISHARVREPTEKLGVPTLFLRLTYLHLLRPPSSLMLTLRVYLSKP